MITICGARLQAVGEILLTNRFHLFALPVLLTAFWNQSMRLPLDWQYYVMITASVVVSYVYNQITDRDEDAINYDAKGHFFANLQVAVWRCGLDGAS